MSVSVRVPTILRPYTQGVSEVSAEGSTLTEVLDSLDAVSSLVGPRVTLPPHYDAFTEFWKDNS